MQRGGVGDGRRRPRQVDLDRVVERPDARGRPQLARRLAGRRGVEHDAARREPCIEVEVLRARVRHAEDAVVLSRAERGGHGDDRHRLAARSGHGRASRGTRTRSGARAARSALVVALGERRRQRLGRVGHRAAADGDDRDRGRARAPTSIRRPTASSGTCCAQSRDTRRAAVAQRVADARLDARALQRARAQQQHALGAEALALAPAARRRSRRRRGRARWSGRRRRSSRRRTPTPSRSPRAAPGRRACRRGSRAR